MDIPVTITNGTPFDSDLGEEGILTVVFTTETEITYKANTTLYFYAEITEDALEQTVCFPLDGADNPLPIGSTSFTIENTTGFTSAASATGRVYYTAV
jgi:hypothetical protein